MRRFGAVVVLWQSHNGYLFIHSHLFPTEIFHSAHYWVGCSLLISSIAMILIGWRATDSADRCWSVDRYNTDLVDGYDTHMVDALLTILIALGLIGTLLIQSTCCSILLALLPRRIARKEDATQTERRQTLMHDNRCEYSRRAGRRRCAQSQPFHYRVKRKHGAKN